MANFLKLNDRVEQRIGQYATRLFRIESHVRQGDLRAAKARVDGFFDELVEFMQDIEFPIEHTVIGMQVGFFSGKGSLLKGRLPGALFGGIAGWLYGHSQTAKQQRYVIEMMRRVRLLEAALLEAEAQRE
ncbi:MAG: hypothetical protein ACQEVA_18685 [Myxococcota bacterium]